VATGCAAGASTPPEASTDAPPTTAARNAAAPVRNDERDARIGEFVTECQLSHRSNADPIVHPHGEVDHAAGPPHSHDFFGTTTTDEHSTAGSLLASRSTNCDAAEDFSAYWTPTASVDGVPIEPTQFAAYYDTAEGIDPATAAPLPPGLVMIAGNAPDPSVTPAGSVGWICGRGRDAVSTTPSCAFPTSLTLQLKFPDCWDGANVDSADHRSHVTYSQDGRCPATHPIAMIRLVLRIQYPVDDPSRLSLASGGVETAHADFVNAWTDRSQQEQIDLCIRRRVTCGVV
jgi:hypothetical protein